jgi:hypothetical protein
MAPIIADMDNTSISTNISLLQLPVERFYVWAEDMVKEGRKSELVGLISAIPTLQ